MCTIYQGGKIYVGYHNKDGKPDGYGQMNYANGLIFKGEYKDGSIIKANYKNDIRIIFIKSSYIKII